MISTLQPKVRGIILDMDGVLWRGNESIGSLPKIFEAVQTLGLKVTFATNNATLSPKQYQEKLASFGVIVETWQIINSAMAAVFLLKKLFPTGGYVFAIGEDGLLSTLAEGGFYQNEDGALAVIVALDRQLTYQKLCRATRLIRSGLPFIGTNSDKTLAVPGGFDPGAGAILGAIEISTDVKPTVVGKPSPVMLELAMQRMQTSEADTLVVGDRLETDILGGFNAGCRTALVLSGVTKESDIEKWSPKPDLVVANLESLLC
ncbi:MAG TPA: HAD-IIA family hydrolase [Anaerolineaceae bacterium]|nr:HAD-IIA family hydrolase [Anaerolineaceae bacterium]